MDRRVHFVIAAALIVMLPLAHASTRDGATRDNAARAVEAEQTVRADAGVDVSPEPTAEALALRASLDALFQPQGEVLETDTGVSALITGGDLVVARVGPDGKLVLGCVDSKEAALRFLEAPIERLPTSRTAREK